MSLSNDIGLLDHDRHQQAQHESPTLVLERIPAAESRIRYGDMGMVQAKAVSLNHTIEPVALRRRIHLFKKKLELLSREHRPPGRGSKRVPYRTGSRDGAYRGRLQAAAAARMRPLQT